MALAYQLRPVVQLRPELIPYPVRGGLLGVDRRMSGAMHGGEAP